MSALLETFLCSVASIYTFSAALFLGGLLLRCNVASLTSLYCCSTNSHAFLSSPDLVLFLRLIFLELISALFAQSFEPADQ